MTLAPHEQRLALRKVALRLTPVLALTYVLAQIDRVNVSFAALHMNADLGFSEAVYGLGAGLFFLGYLLLQVPMNLAIARFGAGRVLAVLMVAWGFASSATALVQTPGQFYGVRMLVGAAESGVYPGIMLYLTYWFPAAQRAGAVGLVALSVPVAGLLGSPLSGLILDHTQGLGGLQSWQWLFILEGMPAAFLAVLVLAVLTDRPAHARWLSPAQRTWLTGTLDAETATEAPAARAPWREALAEPRVWQLAGMYFFFAGGCIASLYWLPRLVQVAAPHASAQTIGWVVGLPFVGFGITTVWWGRRSDRLGERRWHTLAPAALGVSGLMALPFVHGLGPAAAALCVYLLGFGGAFSACWGLIVSSLSPRIAPMGIAMVNSAGSLAAFLGLYGAGALINFTGGYGAGIAVLALALLLGAALALTLPVQRPSPLPATPPAARA